MSQCQFAHLFDTVSKKESVFWKEVENSDVCHGDKHPTCKTFIKIFPEEAINDDLPEFPVFFIKKRNLYNKAQNDASLRKRNKKDDWNLLAVADAARGDYEATKTQGEIECIENNEEWITSRKALKSLGFSRTTLSQRVKDGFIQVRKEGGKTYYLKSSVEECKRKNP